jgi:hypothetical protein
VFPPQINDFQKPIKFVSTSGKVLFGKESEKASEEKPIEKSSGEKPSEQPEPKTKPKLVRFHCGYCGKKRVTRMSFASRGSMRKDAKRVGEQG